MVLALDALLPSVQWLKGLRVLRALKPLRSALHSQEESMQSPWPSLEVALGLHCLLQHVCMQQFFARPSLVWCSMLECHMFRRYAVQHAMTCSAALLGIDTQKAFARKTISRV